MPKKDKEGNEGGARPATKHTREVLKPMTKITLLFWIGSSNSSILDRFIVIKEKLTTLLQLVPQLQLLKVTSATSTTLKNKLKNKIRACEKVRKELILRMKT